MDAHRSLELLGKDPPPSAPISVLIWISAEDWSYVERRLTELLQKVQVQGCLTNGIQGGGGGSTSQVISFRPISIEDYRADLQAWFDRQARP